MKWCCACVLAVWLAVASAVPTNKAQPMRFMSRVLARDPLEDSKRAVAQKQAELNTEQAKYFKTTLELWKEREKTKGKPKQAATDAWKAAEQALIRKDHELGKLKKVREKELYKADKAGKLTAWKSKWASSEASCKSTCFLSHPLHKKREKQVLGKGSCSVIKDAFACFNEGALDVSKCTECICPEWALTVTTKVINYHILTSCVAIGATFEDGTKIGAHLVVDFDGGAERPYDASIKAIGDFCKTKKKKIKAYGVAGNVGWWVWSNAQKKLLPSMVVGAADMTTSAGTIGGKVRDALATAGCQFTAANLAPKTQSAHDDSKDLLWTGAAWIQKAKFTDRNKDWPVPDYAGCPLPNSDGC